MVHKRLTLFAGHYGSGKTNIAVNYALALARENRQVCIADLDIVNPYFRTADSAQQLHQAGVTLIASRFANSNVDLPALPAEAYRLVEDQSIYGVMDIGGDDRGAYALGRYVPFIQKENNYRMVFVANCYRPLTQTVSDTVQIMREIEAACGLCFTDVINNSNLGPMTQRETVLDSIPYIQELSAETGLPIWCTALRQDLVSVLKHQIPNILPLHLQEKIFDLPDQRI